MLKTDYTREELIELCEKSIVSETDWSDRDSSSSQRQVGETWALLKSGCDFTVLTEGDLKTDDQTIWLEITFQGFNAFEGGNPESETSYLPTWSRLKSKMIGSDWY